MDNRKSDMADLLSKAPIPDELTRDNGSLARFPSRNINFINVSPHPDPDYAKPGDSGMDLRAWIKPEEGTVVDGVPQITLKPLERRLIHTGIYYDLDLYCEIQVRPKSGRALKEGLSVLNTPGTVDNQYQGECCVIAVNLSNDDIIIKDGEKIAQAVVCPVYYKERVVLNKVDKFFTKTERGSGGFGHTGI